MTGRRPWACVQVDLDEVWTLSALYGDKAAFREPSCYREALSRFEEILGRLALKATFFVVGRDLLDAGVRDRIRSLSEQGHEIASHSFSHPLGFSRLGTAKKREEIGRAHDLLAAAVGEPPCGFRAPSYDIDGATLEILKEAGYLYDASVLPSPLPPLLRAVDALLSLNMSALDLYGKGSPARIAPNRPYRPSMDRPWQEEPRETFIEVPVTSIPFLRIPFTSSLTLNRGRPLFRIGYELIRRSGVPLVFLMHGVDLVDRLEERSLPFYKRIGSPPHVRTARIEWALRAICTHYEVIPTRAAVRRLLEQRGPEPPPESAQRAGGWPSTASAAGRDQRRGGFR